MKKFLGIMLAGIFGIALSVGVASAADCLNIKFDNGDSVCLGITKSGTSNFKMSVSKNNLSTNASLKCSILLPNNKIQQLNACKGSFTYNGSSTQAVKIYASYTDNKGKSYFRRYPISINFNNGSWGSDNNVISVSSSSSSSSSSSHSSSDIELSANRTSPSTSQYVNLTIKTDKNYTGKLYLSAKYRRYSSDSWSNISNVSSTYFNDYSTDWNNEYYKMTSSDRGNVTLNNLVKFRKDGYYRIYVKDTDGNESYIQFSVGDVSSSSDGEIKLSVSPSNPDTYEWVKLTIETDDDYTGKINFSKLQYRSSSSDSWSTISNLTSSSYISDYSTDWYNGYYKMTSSDDGYVALKNLVKFNKKGYYRIYVKDTDGNESYVQINVNVSGSSSSNDDLKVSASPSNPDTYEWVKLTIETDDDYTGKINFSKLQYRSSSSDSWTNVSNLTSSSYVSDYSSDWRNGYYKMTSSDYGYVTLKNLVKFNKKGYYRIYVEDTDGNESYVQINVNVSGSSSNDDIEVSASPSNPDTYEWVKLTIETDRNYTGKVKFSKFQYKSSSSSSWTTISNTTSNTYVSDYSTDWSNGYYKMTSSDKGYVTLKNLVKFKKSGYYRIYVEDTDGNENYVQINVDVSSSSSSSSSDKVKLSTNRKSPSTSQYVNLTIETDSTRYTGKLTFSAKYRSSSSDSWSSITRTSSSYFSDYSDEWDDGYYRMTSSDKGEVTLKNLVKFKKNGYYRIYVEDTSGNESYIQFSVGNVSDSGDDESNVSGFSTSEFAKVKSTYKERDNMIAQMKRNYPKLKNDTYWERLSNNFYNDMKDVVNNKSVRDFKDFEDFQEAFDDWYKYTLQNI